MNIIFQARNFFIFGIINLLITNLILQISLLILPIWISTLISQIINYILGFYLYGKFVFKKNKTVTKNALKYLIVALFSWKINTIFIYLLSYLFGYKESIAAIIVIPLLVIYSFIAQKYFVFR